MHDVGLRVWGLGLTLCSRQRFGMIDNLEMDTGDQEIKPSHTLSKKSANNLCLLKNITNVRAAGHCRL